MTPSILPQNNSVIEFPITRDAKVDQALRDLGLDPVLVGPVDERFGLGIARMPGAWARSYSRETLAARRTDLRRFASWCRARNVSLLAWQEALEDHIVDHLQDVSGSLGASSVKRASVALTAFARGLGLSGPSLEERVRLTLRARNRLARARDKALRPAHVRVDLPEIGAMKKAAAEAPGSEVKRLRDVAIVALMAGLMLRRSDIAHFRLIDWDAGRREITIAHAKADQEGSGCIFEVSASTAQALDAWLEASGLATMEGKWLRARTPLFTGVRKSGALLVNADGDLRPLTGRSVSRILKRHGASVGIEGVSGHTLRRSVARILIERKTDEVDVMAAGRWKSVEVMHAYVGLEDRPVSAAELLGDL